MKNVVPTGGPCAWSGEVWLIRPDGCAAKAGDERAIARYLTEHDMTEHR